MEKKIFDMDLNSLMGEPIDVDGAGDDYSDVFFDKDDEVKKENKPEKLEDDSELIDLEEETIDTEEEVKEIDEVEEEEPSSDSQKSKANAKSSSPLTPYAKLLKDEGILPNLDVETFDGTADGLKEAMYTEIVGMVEAYKDSLPDRVKNLINNYEEGVPFEKLLEIDRSEAELSEVSKEGLSEDADLQKKVVREYLKKTTKFSDKKINSTIEYYEDTGELESEAETSLDELKSLVEKDKEDAKKYAERSRQDAEKERVILLQQLNDSIMKSKEIIPGIPLNEKVRKAVYSSLTTAAGKDQHGNPLNRLVVARMEDPLNFEVKLHYLFEITKGFTDFSKLSDKGKKDTTKEFEEAIEQLDKTGGSGASNPSTSNRAILRGIEKTYHIK